MKLQWSLVLCRVPAFVSDAQDLQLSAVGLVEELGALDDDGVDLSGTLCQRAAGKQRRRGREGGCHAEASHHEPKSWISTPMSLAMYDLREDVRSKMLLKDAATVSRMSCKLTR